MSQWRRIRNNAEGEESYIKIMLFGIQINPLLLLLLKVSFRKQTGFHRISGNTDIPFVTSESTQRKRVMEGISEDIYISPFQ